jgi:hypothetical protein
MSGTLEIAQVKKLEFTFNTGVRLMKTKLRWGVRL